MVIPRTMGMIRFRTRKARRPLKRLRADRIRNHETARGEPRDPKSPELGGFFSFFRATTDGGFATSIRQMREAMDQLRGEMLGDGNGIGPRVGEEGEAKFRQLSTNAVSRCGTPM